MKKGRKLLACLVLIVMVLSQVPSNLLVRAKEGKETKYKLSFELERDASALNEIYQKHDEAEDQSEKADEKASDKVTTGEAGANKDNETVVDLSQETEAEEKTEENSSEEAKPIDEGVAGDESNQANEDEAIVLPSGGGEGPQEEKAEEVKDLNITYTVHIKGESEESIEKRIIYSVEKADFVGDLKFEGIEALSNELEVKYYSKEDGSSFDEKSENFDLYLETNSEKTVLELPRIGEKEDSLRVKESNFEEALEISEEKIGEAVGDPNLKEIYLNGTSGDDTKDGSKEENAVKTFKKAKELAGTDKNIIVVGTTDITGDISLEGANQKVIRGEKFNKYLFNVPANTIVSLSDIYIHGNYEKNKTTEESAIKVNRGATLNIGKNATIYGNKIKAIPNTATEGGAIHATDATINMIGGSVEENQATYGGGIYLKGSIMNFTGGAVQNNKSDLVVDSIWGQVYSAGGGIAANEGSVINITGSALITNNFAAEIGGGISIGTQQASDKSSELNMSAGIISENIAGSSGGGIFIQSSIKTSVVNKANISSGKIINNKMDGSGITNKAFGGGGIYVNGMPEVWEWQGHTYNCSNGVLNLKNAIIKNNTSQKEGAGYAACPVSKSTIYINDGVALYDNELKDLFIYCNTNGLFSNYNDFDINEEDPKLGTHAGNPKYMLSRRMLGGPLNNWANKDNSIAIPEDAYDKEMTIGEHKAYLYLYNKNKASEFTRRIATVEISGNTSATRGAGIGSNGTVIFGTDNETTEVKVKKVWNDEKNKDKKRPSSIKVKLMANIEGDSNKYEVETIELNKKNKSSYEFKNLPSKSNGKKIKYSVKEATEKDGEVIEEKDGKIKIDEQNYKVEYSYDESNKTILITNTPEEPKKEIKVSKVWDTVDKKAFTKDITVELYKNNEKTNKTLILNAENNWQGSFKDLDIKDKNNEEITYTIKEAGETDNKITLDGKEFKVSYSGNETTGYTITNSYYPPEEPKKEYRDISVEKAWDIRGMKPIRHIEVELYRDGEATGNTLVLSEANGWSGSFKNLEKASDGGHIYKYSVKEIGEKFYTVEISGEYYEVIYKGDMDSGFTIINREEPKKPQRRDIRVSKVWDVTNEIPVDEIQVELYKDGRATGNEITLSEANGWMGHFEDLLAYDAEGVKYEYSVREVGEASHKINILGTNYEVSYEGDMNYSFVITNKENIPPKKKTEIRVSKTWRTSSKTEAVQVELYMDGAATGKVITLSEDNGWSGVFTELETEDASRIRHIYTVKEIGETFGQYNIGERRFTVTYEGSMDTGFNIVNSEEIPKEKDEKSKDKDEKPKDKNTKNEKHIIPKTGVEEGTLSIVLALVVLAGLFFVKKKITKSKSK